MAELSKSGMWFDEKANRVVESQPEEGVLIVAPGGEITAAVEAEEKRWREVEAGNPTPVAETVTTESVAPKKSPKKEAE